jgi:pyrroloquinoline quinone biosynthesis protein D
MYVWVLKSPPTFTYAKQYRARPRAAPAWRTLMSEQLTFQLQDRPLLSPMFLLRWEKTQDAHVLLYPEGVIKLNGSAAEILKRCNGETTVAGMVDELKALFVDVGASEIETGINKFLETAHAKGWIRSR